LRKTEKLDLQPGQSGEGWRIQVGVSQKPRPFRVSGCLPAKRGYSYYVDNPAHLPHTPNQYRAETANGSVQTTARYQSYQSSEAMYELSRRPKGGTKRASANRLRAGDFMRGQRSLQQKQSSGGFGKKPE
jgi:hypothetical protein